MDMDEEFEVESDQFIEYEAIGGKKRALENMDDMFARIEAQQQRQEELQQRKLAKQQQQQQQQATSNTTNKTNTSTSKGGWKSGFLSSSNDNNTNKKEKPVSAPTIPSETNTNKAQPICAPSNTNVAPKVDPSTLSATPNLAETTESRRVQFRAENDVLEIDNREQLAAKVKEMKIEERKNELATKRAKDIADAEAAIQAEEQATGKPRVPPKKPFSGMILEKFP